MQETSHGSWWKVLLGVLLVGIGVIGLVLPVLQGMFFIAAGLLLLSDSIPSVRMRLSHLETRYPSLHAGLETMRTPTGALHISKVLVMVLIVSAISAGVLFGIHFLRMH